jgi:cell fate (sporulation/competence/biofilm development) regulator YlbF (YheA/YmcA/DUF963 family)
MQKTAVLILFRSLSSLLVVFGLLGCKVLASPPPYEEYNLARAAVRAAQEADSARFATGIWNKAEESFRSGQKAYKEADYDAAKKFFQAAQLHAEKAENVTRLKKFQTGENFP